MSDSPAAEWKEVERLVQAERYEEARTAYLQFIQRHPKEADAYKAILPRPIAALYRLEQYEQVIPRDPVDVYGYRWQKGQALATLKRYDEALTAYEQAIQHASQLPPTDVRGSAAKLSRLKCGYKGKGEVLSALQRHDEALAAYEQLIQLDQTDGDGYKGKGEVLSTLQRDAEAQVLYEQALVVYEQAIRRAAPFNHLAFPMLEVRQKLHHPLAPAGQLSADVADNDLNGSRYGSHWWRAPASFQGAIVAGQHARYEVLQRLRDTALTTSYRARDLASDRPVLVKVLYPRVLVYLCTIAPGRLGLSDPHLEQLLGYGIEGTCCYLVTEFLEGPTLREQMAREAPCAVERAVEVATQIVQGLKALWQQGITNGVLEPATIVLGDEQGLKLTDPGLRAAWMPLRKLMTSSEPVVEVNAAYCAPEYAQDEYRTYGIQLDLYALACIFFELLTGQPPYQGKNPIEVVVQQIKSPIPSICALRPDLTPAFDAFFEKALAKQPDDRYQTPQALLQALTTLPGARD